MVSGLVETITNPALFHAVVRLQSLASLLLRMHPVCQFYKYRLKQSTKSISSTSSNR
jgi:hypothetical protein